jgi:hypothetical protein
MYIRQNNRMIKFLSIQRTISSVWPIQKRLLLFTLNCQYAAAETSQWTVDMTSGDPRQNVTATSALCKRTVVSQLHYRRYRLQPTFRCNIFCVKDWVNLDADVIWVKQPTDWPINQLATIRMTHVCCIPLHTIQEHNHVLLSDPPCMGSQLLTAAAAPD